MKEEVLVISADRYNMIDEDTKQESKGTTLWYVSGDLDHAVQNGSDSLGMKPAKASMEYDFFDKAVAAGIPCKAEIIYAMRPNKNGQMILKPMDIQFLKTPVTSK